jgi:DNA adenine methylase
VVQPPGFNLERLPLLIENTHTRLARVQLECLPYEEVLKRYDRPTTLFYLDPPYFGRKLYRYNFETQDYEKLAERLGALRGKFILSLNDVPEVRAIFREFPIKPVTTTYTAQKKSGRRYGEVFITNFAP